MQKKMEELKKQFDNLQKNMPKNSDSKDTD